MTSFSTVSSSLRNQISKIQLTKVVSFIYPICIYAYKKPQQHTNLIWTAPTKKIIYIFIEAAKLYADNPDDFKAKAKAVYDSNEEEKDEHKGKDETETAEVTAIDQ